MAPISDLVEEIKPRLVTDYYDMTSVNEALAKFVTYFDWNKRLFWGTSTVHCEALLMALTAFAYDRAAWMDRFAGIFRSTADCRRIKSCRGD